MTAYNLDPVALDIFDLMRRQPGDAFSPGELVDRWGYARAEIDAGLQRLLELGLAERVTGETEAYRVSPAAPEL